MRLVAEINLPGLPKTTNTLNRMNWRLRSKHADAWKTATYLSCLKHRITNLKLKTAKLTLIRHSGIEPDFDGLVGSFKYVIDGLKRAGVIIEDSTDVIGQPSYAWEKAKKKAGFITVRIETIEPEEMRSFI